MASDGSVIIEIDGDSSKFEKALKGVDSVASGTLKGLGVASAAAVSAVVTVGTAAVTAYADYEQLVGGIGKIFDEMDTSVILKDSQEAWKNLNMSASDYLATIVDIGANFASTMGDEKGYEAAKRGMQAISNYASGTGKSMDVLSEKLTMITRSTSSYQSIADQFSGILPATSQGFLDQAQAAGFLSDSYQKLTEVPIDEYQQAVTLMLERGVDALNLTGNTAAETEKTLSGSIAATKATWENLLVGLADETQDFDALIDTFVGSVSSLGDNLLPVMEDVLEGIVKLVSALGPKIAGMLPDLAGSVLPGLVSGATEIVSALADVIPGLIQTIANVVNEQGPMLIQAGMDILASLGSGIVSSAPTLITAAVNIIQVFAESLGGTDMMANMVVAAAEIITTLALALTDPAFVASLVNAAANMITSLVQGITEALPVLLAAAPVIIQNLATAIIDNLPVIIDCAITIVQMLVQTLLDNLPLIAETAIALNLALIEGLLSCLPDLHSAAFDLAKALIDTIMETDWWSLGSDIISGIASGVSGAVGLLADAARNVAQSALNSIKSALGIASPSKVFAREVGRWIPPGIGQGAEEAMPALNEDMRKQLMHTIDDASAAVAFEVGHVNRRLSGTGGTGSGGGESSIITNENGMTVIVHYTGSAEPEDIRKLGRQIGVETSREIRRKGIPAV